MCKHVAAVLYGVGARLDDKPELLFRLRAVDASELVGRIDAALPLSKKGMGADKVLQTGDVSALFGLDMADAPEAIPPPDEARRASTRVMAPRPVGAAPPVAAPPTAPPRSAVPTKHAAVARRTTVRLSTLKKAASEIRKAPVKTAIPKQKAAAAQNTHSGSLASKKAEITTASHKAAVPIRKAAPTKGKPKPNARVRATGRPAKRAG